MRKEVTGAGRSINLALSDRGIKALEEVGIMEEISEDCHSHAWPLYPQCRWNEAYQPYGKEGQFINSVSRAELNAKLMDLAEANDVEILFDMRCSSIDWKKNEMDFNNDDSSEIHETPT